MTQDICPQGHSRQTISAWQLRLLSPAEHAVISEHIAHCAICQQRVTEYNQLDSIIKEKPYLIPQHEIWQNVRSLLTSSQVPTITMKRRQMLSIGSAFLVVALIATATIFALHRSANVQPKPTLQKPMLYTLASNYNDQYYFNAYDHKNGQLQFTHTITSGALASPLLATLDNLGILTIDASGNSSLHIFNYAGTQLHQIDFGIQYPEVAFASRDAFFVGMVSRKGSPFAKLVAYKADTGALLWQQTFPNVTNLDQFLVAGQEWVENLQISDGTAVTTAINITNGTQTWQRGTAVSPPINLAAASKDIIYGFQPPASAHGVNLVAFAASNGKQLWSIPFFPFNPNDFIGLQIIATDANTLYCEETLTIPDVSVSSHLEAFAASNGKQLWSIPDANNVVDTVTIANNILYIELNDTLLALDVTNGATEWRRQLKDSMNGNLNLLVFDNTVYLGVKPVIKGTPSPNTLSIQAFRAGDGSPIWQTQATGVYFGGFATIP